MIEETSLKIQSICEELQPFSLSSKIIFITVKAMFRLVCVTSHFLYPKKIEFTFVLISVTVCFGINSKKYSTSLAFKKSQKKKTYRGVVHSEIRIC